MLKRKSLSYQECYQRSYIIVFHRCLLDCNPGCRGAFAFDMAILGYAVSNALFRFNCRLHSPATAAQKHNFEDREIALNILQSRELGIYTCKQNKNASNIAPIADSLISYNLEPKSNRKSSSLLTFFTSTNRLYLITTAPPHISIKHTRILTRALWATAPDRHLVLHIFVLVQVLSHAHYSVHIGLKSVSEGVSRIGKGCKDTIGGRGCSSGAGCTGCVGVCGSGNEVDGDGVGRG